MFDSREKGRKVRKEKWRQRRKEGGKMREEVNEGGRVVKMMKRKMETEGRKE